MVWEAFGGSLGLLLGALGLVLGSLGGVLRSFLQCISHSPDFFPLSGLSPVPLSGHSPDPGPANAPRRPWILLPSKRPTRFFSSSSRFGPLVHSYDDLMIIKNLNITEKI